jgi:hypothetical protein
VDGTCDTHERGQKSVQGLVGKPKGKRPLARPRSRWEDGIKMDLRKIGSGCREYSVGYWLLYFQATAKLHEKQNEL